MLGDEDLFLVEKTDDEDVALFYVSEQEEGAALLAFCVGRCHF